MTDEQAYERYAGEWASILSAGFESFLGIGFFWQAISGTDPITGDILSEAEQKSALLNGSLEFGISIISAACAASGFGSFLLLLGAEGLSGSMAAMTYEGAVLSGMSETEAAILAFLTGMMSGCALDDLISNSGSSMTKLGKQLGKSPDEMADVMGGLKRLAAENNFSSVDEMLDAALNNPSRLPAVLYDDIIEAIDGPMGGFNLPKNVDADVPSAAGRIENGIKYSDVTDIGEVLQVKGGDVRGSLDDFVVKYKQSEEYLNLSNAQRKMVDRKLYNLKKGNVAVADVDIPGIKSEFKAHSQIHSRDVIGSSVDDFSYTPKPEKRVFETYVEDVFPRYNDTEAKILEDIASQITDPNIKGTINLYSELDCCQSCSNIILEFRSKYPNIKLNIFTNGTIN